MCAARQVLRVIASVQNVDEAVLGATAAANSERLFRLV